ncbi:MAG TPA: sigma-70 family RNA polymerase sigma factor [Pyrinomonadaceae bacterium]|nr:sigma-70 family RNA polymerase sigma factor [Pyrinomonadaceae bacterium]HRK49116.1 sigma-70 family RNA polymerase sigma factor [Pyrinomonadaceae bacterium]
MSKATETFVDSMSEQATAAAAKETIEFEEAFSLHHRTVFRAARSVVRDAALAEDVTQEVFVKLYKNLNSINDPEMLRPWLIRVALNLAKNTVRGNIRANTRDENYVKETVENSVISVESEYEQKSELNEVNRALSKVKEPLRSCLVLKQQGLSYREIAESLSLNETSIGTYVARARQEFLRFYGKVGRETL